MKIGLISSGNDTLALRKVLTKYDHEYLICHDQTFFPFGEKDFNTIKARLQKHLQFLQTQQVEGIILDPLYELALKETNHQILPLFETYVYEEVLPHTLVGKIGLLCEKGESQQAERIIMQATANYQLTPAQSKNKAFNFPFLYRIKTPKAWQRGIQELGVHNPYLIKTLKNDLRYFKDANIDTLLPLQYGYFAMGRTIKAFFTRGKTRFFDFTFIEKSFKKLTASKLSPQYQVQLYTNEAPDFIRAHKQIMWVLARGKSITIDWQNLP